LVTASAIGVPFILFVQWTIQDQNRWQSSKLGLTPGVSQSASLNNQIQRFYHVRPQSIAKEDIVRIRDLQWKGLPAWPPEWWFSDEEAGEEGFLKNVQFRYDQTQQCISVVATHLGNDRNGIIILENSLHLEILCNKLKENIGRPLKEIGDLDIDFLLSIPKKGLKKVRQTTRQGSHSAAFPPVAVKLKSKQ
jgi:hypothetical protein